MADSGCKPPRMGVIGIYEILQDFELRGSAALTTTINVFSIFSENNLLIPGTTLRPLITTVLWLHLVNFYLSSLEHAFIQGFYRFISV